MIDLKKKVKARDLREAKKQEKIAVYSAAAKAAVGDKSAVEAKPVRPVEAAHEDKAVGNKKSVNKAAGLKSTLVYDDKFYMTSFGRGNSAVVEQRIDTSDYSVSDMNASPSLRVSEAGKINVSFSSLRQFVNAGQLSAVNPLYGGKDKPQKKTGQDMLGLKDKLEERYFGMTFNDNIHIQIIHNILDIEKILAVYTTNIAVALDHMVDEEIDAERDEFIGYMNTLNTYEVFMNPEKKFGAGDKRVKNITESRDKFEKLLATKRMGYFGFDYDSNGKDKHKNEELKKRLYHLVAFAGQLRQWSFHGDTGINPNSWLYRLDDKKLDQEYRDTLDYYFDIRFDEINEKFVEQNATNLCILRELFPNDDFKAVADLYYDFIVIKAQKNIGFSLKKLREKMLESEEATPVKAQDMDSVRSKLYKLMDFCIFKYYTEHPEISNKNVDILRASVSDEQKESFYTDEAYRLWGIFGGQFLSFCSRINKWVTGEHQKEVLRYIDKDAYRRQSSVSYFSKLLYVMCFFLDGKEINDLLTTLINKFDNIASFINTAKELGINVSFVKDYEFFNSSDRYVPELNIVKNISRMKKPAESVKKEMYRDALAILGVPSNMSREAFDAELEKILEKKIDPKTGKPIKGGNPFRNFIANNVIDNRRFIYVIKFCNPENVRRLVNNINVTEFVLRTIPEAQIDRYYKTCIVSELNPVPDKKISELAKMIKDINFGEFRGVQQKAHTREEALEKERFKAVIGLYLTVVYLLVKNLVNVNARYVMAFHCLERDALLYGENVGNDYLNLSETLCSENENSRSGYLARNRRLRECVKQDISNAHTLKVRNYRNNVAHLSAVRNCAEYIGDITKIDSYFALYHYIIQRLLAKGTDRTAADFESRYPYFAQLFKWNTYVKDMVKALNAPFGYNLPRFKNLSIDDLFDRNEMKKASADVK